MNVWRVALVGALALVVPLSGQQRDDFARGVTVEVEENRPFFELPIPDEVYRTVARADLGDLRVFNRNGSVVPHVVRRPGARPGERLPPQALPFYAMRGRAGDTTAVPTLQVTADGRGVIVGPTADTGAPAEAERVTAYVIDLAALSSMPDTLDLTWEGTADDGFAVTVEVEASDDLARWSALASGATLAELRSSGTTLVRKTIALPEFRAKYLRTSWPEPLAAVTLTGVMASFPAETELPARQTLLVPGALAGTEPVRFDFDTGGMRPVDRVRVVLQERNTVMQAWVRSRPTPDDQWRPRFEGRFYNLEHTGTLLQNEAVDIASTHDRYWQVELAEAQVRPAQAPRLEIAWVPEVLTAVAQGDGPFTVAFGSAVVGPADRTTEGVLGDIERGDPSQLISPVRMSPVQTLGGDSRLQPPPPPPPWRTWVLWAVLLAGVGLLAWMARQLARQQGG
jgi:hypothetical protein